MNSRRLTPLHRVGLTTDDQKWQVERAGKRALLESEAPSLISVRLGSGSIDEIQVGRPTRVTA
jgi:hypothetical protein